MELIERVTSGREGVTIEAPKIIRDRDSGSLREFDIFITANVGNHHPLTIAIECKDHRRKIDVGPIEAFETKCGRNHIARKVFVSNSGYGEPALAKARAVGIDCLTVEEAKEFDWLKGAVFSVFRRQLGLLHIRVICAAEPFPEAPYLLRADSGTVLDDEAIARAVNNALNDHDGGAGVEKFDEPFQVVFSDIHCVITADGREWPILKVEVTGNFTVTKDRDIPFQLHSYGNGEKRSEIAATSIQHDGKELNVALLKNEDETITAKVFINDLPSEPTPK